MSDPDRTISHEELVELQKKFSEIKHSINNALAVIMALSEMSSTGQDAGKGKAWAGIIIGGLMSLVLLALLDA